MHKKIANIVKKYAKFFVKKHKNKYGKIITDLQHKNNERRKLAGQCRTAVICKENRGLRTMPVSVKCVI